MYVIEKPCFDTYYQNQQKSFNQGKLNNFF